MGIKERPILKPGYWRHRNAVDLDIGVAAPAYGGKKYVRVKCWWVLQKDHSFVVYADKVMIRRDDLKNWRWVGPL